MLMYLDTITTNHQTYVTQFNKLDMKVAKLMRKHNIEDDTDDSNENDTETTTQQKF